MKGHISDSKINEIRERTDIVELVSQYVSLKRSGGNYSGLCPFHSEKTPSFSVNAARQFFHCFGCGVGGDAFSFLMKIEGLSFPDAARRLGDRLGIDLEEEQLSPEEERRQRQRDLLFDINKAAAAYFHQQLMETSAGKVGQRYLSQRGYRRDTAETFELGYAAKSWNALRDHLLECGFRSEDVRRLGLIRQGEQGHDYDLFRGRLMVPIHDLVGRVVAFGGRVLDESKPKYINSPESPIYHKSSVLFGLFQARHAMRQVGEVLVVEGYFDQLALFRAGFKHAVATCGTALTAEHAKLIKRYAQRVLLLFDQDAAGRTASFKAMRVLQDEGLPSRIVELSSGEDPDSFLRENTAEAFEERLKTAQPAMDLFMQDRLAGTQDSVEARAFAAEEILAVIADLPSELEQDLYLKKLAVKSGIELELLRNKWSLLLRQRLQQRENPPRESRAELPLGEDYPLPPPPPEYEQDYADAYSPAEVVAPREIVPAPVAPPQRSEIGLLSLMMLGLIDRSAFAEADGQKLFRHPDAIAIADAWQAIDSEDVSDKDIRIKKILDQLTPEQSRLARDLAVDDGRFNSENALKVTEDCCRDLEKLALKERSDDLLTQLIPAAERAGDTAQADMYCKEWTALQQRLKGRK
jgi:DNA primase